MNDHLSGVGFMNDHPENGLRTPFPGWKKDLPGIAARRFPKITNLEKIFPIR
jgi:hypothetical protein